MTDAPADVATPRLFGPFEVLGALELPHTSATDLYEGFYAGFYDDFTREERWDVERYVERAQAVEGTVLELACGSGRIALPLARAGVEVHAVDLAPDMLRLLARRLEAEEPAVAARVRVDRADMVDLTLYRRFGLAILGATSVCLLHESERRVAMFAAVARHLEPGGTLLFDFVATDPDTLRAQDGELIAVPAVSGSLKRFTLLGRRWLEDEGVQLVNFYSEVVDGEGATRRFLGSTVKTVLDEAMLVAEARRGGLEVVSVETVLEAPEEAGDEIRLVECRVR